MPGIAGFREPSAFVIEIYEDLIKFRVRRLLIALVAEALSRTGMNARHSRFS